MKKIILNLGLATITVLPIVAVASCSSVSTESPSIDTEVKKLEQTFPVKETSKSMTTWAAIDSINKGSQEEKMAMLETLVDMPEMDKNFTYTIEKASIGTNNDQAIDVTIRITEIATPANTKTIKMAINGLTKADSPLQVETKRFNISSPANEVSKKLKVTAIEKLINEASETEKLTKLKEITTVPAPSTGFTIKVLSAKTGTTETSVDVKISITQTSDNQSLETIFTITELTPLDATEKLAQQADLLINQEVLEPKKTETPLEASIAIMEKLEDYYKPIVLSTGITYVITSAKPNATTLTTLDVVLTVSSNIKDVVPITRNIQITGFTSPIVALANKAKLIESKAVLSTKAGETAAQASKSITSDATLEAYYEKVALGTGYTYVWKSTKLIGDTVEVTVSVSSTDPLANSPIEHKFIISGFKTEFQALVEEFKKPHNSISSLLTTAYVIRDLNDTKTPAEKLTKLKTFVPTFPKTTSNIDVIVGSAARISDALTSIKVSLTIVQSNPALSERVDFTITGLTNESNAAELNRIANDNLKNKPVLTAKADETAETAAKAITSIETLANYYNLITLPEGLKYVFGSVKLENNTLRVSLTILDTATNVSSNAKSFLITAFPTAFEAEAMKFNTSLAAKDSSLHTTTAIRQITEPTAQADKVKALQALVNNFPSLTDGYSLTINSAAADTTITSSVKVSIKVSENNKPKSTGIDVTFTITNLTAETPEQELTRLSNLLITKDVLKDRAEETLPFAIKRMNEKNFNEYYAPITMPKGITYKFVGIKVIKPPRAIEVEVEVKNENETSLTLVKKSIIITGFKNPTSLDNQASMFETSLAAKTSGTTTAAAAVSEIKAAKTQTDKLAKLKSFINENEFPNLDAEYDLVIGEPTLDQTSTTSIHIPIRVINKVVSETNETPSQTSITAVFTITGLATETEQEKLQRLSDLLLVTQEVSKGKAGETLPFAVKRINEKNFDQYYAPIQMPDGITYKYKNFKTLMPSINGLSVDVEVTKNSDKSLKPVIKTVIIKGFKKATALDNQAVMFETSVVAKAEGKVTAAVAISEIKAATTQVDKLAKLKSLINISDFPTLDSTKYELLIGEPTLDEVTTSINIAMTIGIKSDVSGDKNLETEAPVPVTFTITGLATETEQEKLQRLSDLLLVTQEVSQGKAGETLPFAVKRINEKNFDEYYKKITMPTGITYKYKKIKSLMMSINGLSVELEVTNSSSALSSPVTITKTVIIKGFKTPTALDNQAVMLETSMPAKSKETTTSTVISEIKAANTQAEKLTKLKSFINEIDFPSFDNAKFDLVIGEPTVDKTKNTSVNISITISSKAASSTSSETETPAEEPIVVTFTITDLTPAAVIE